jgi:hypothetical protein
VDQGTGETSLLPFPPPLPPSLLPSFPPFHHSSFHCPVFSPTPFIHVPLTISPPPISSLPPSLPPSLSPSLPRALPGSRSARPGGLDLCHVARRGGARLWGVPCVRRGREPEKGKEGGREGGGEGGKEGGRERLDVGMLLLESPFVCFMMCLLAIVLSLLVPPTSPPFSCFVLTPSFSASSSAFPPFFPPLLQLGSGGDLLTKFTRQHLR